MIAQPRTRQNFGPRRAATAAEADAQTIIANPPGAEWDGVWVMESK